MAQAAQAEKMHELKRVVRQNLKSAKRIRLKVDRFFRTVILKRKPRRPVWLVALKTGTMVLVAIVLLRVMRAH